MKKDVSMATRHEESISILTYEPWTGGECIAT